jgi:nitroreductase
VDTFLAIVSKREVRRYADRPLPSDVVRRILEAGRLAGSSQNKQARRFVILDRTKQDVARCVFAPANIEGAALAVAIVLTGGRGPAGLDAGRALQNMMLAAWNDGVGSCPNGLADPDEISRLLALGEGERVANIVSFGYPAREIDPERRTPEEWIAAADRKPLDEIVSTA